MTHRIYLDGSNEETKHAFLCGCRCVMKVITHCNPTDIINAVSRNDEDWIRFLCDKESEREEDEQRAVIHNILKHYQPIDREVFRGMLLDRERIDDEGNAVDENGNICHRPFPHQVYEYMGSDSYPPRQISNEEYAKLPEEEKGDYMRCAYVELTAQDRQSKRRFYDYERAFMDLTAQKLIPSEPNAVLELYRRSLEECDKGTLIAGYRDLIEKTIDIRQFSQDVNNFYNNLKSKTDQEENLDDIPEDIAEDIDQEENPDDIPEDIDI